jgi:hypothetical protein
MEVTFTGNTKSMEVSLEVFNFDDPKAWKKVVANANHPLVLRALDAGMMMLCRERRMEWLRDRGPWSYSLRSDPHWQSLTKRPPKPGTLKWYRVFGDRHALSPWAATIGSLLYPDHEWSVAYAFNVRSISSHSAGLGMKEGRTPSVIIMDPHLGRRALRKQTERELLTMLLRQPSENYPFQIAIAMLECGEKIHHAKR